MRFILISLCLSIGTFGCQTRAFNTNSNPTAASGAAFQEFATIAEVPEAKCPEGEMLQRFSLGDVPTQKLPVMKIGDYEIVDEWSTPSNDNGKIAIDVCVNTDLLSAKFAQVIFKDKDSKIQLFKLTQNSVEKGLTEMIFDQDYKNLEIRIPFDKGKEFLIKGFQDNKGKLALVAKLRTNSNTFETSSWILVGGFSAANSCDFGSTSIQSKFTRGGVKFSFDFCATRIGFDGLSTSTFELLSIEVEDTNKNLVSGNNKFKATTKDEIKKIIKKEEYNHHNFCDRLELQFPHATYALRSDGCSGDSNDPKYLFTYKNGTKLTGKMQCRHFLLDKCGD